MGLFDQLAGSVKGILDSMGAADSPALITQALGKTDLGNLNGVADQLRQGGLEEQVRSWLGGGANMPASAEQIRSALGNDQVAQLAKQFGIPVDAALQLLAQHLPAAIDQASPNETMHSS